MNIIRDLHHAGIRPQWEDIPDDQLNVDQRLAKRTRGVLKLANAISFLGFVSTIKGINELSESHYKKGLAYVAVGRASDIADGAIAKLTGTIDPYIGEKLDAGLDKIALAYALIKLTRSNKISDDVALLFAAQHLSISALTLIAENRGVDIKPSESGKINTALNWGSLGLHVLGEGLKQNERPEEAKYAKIGAYTLTAVSVAVGAKAIWGYANKALGSTETEDFNQEISLEPIEIEPV